ncbi:MAG: peptidase C15 [Jaaginema sp. PMC 1080.18]|nr:peptidase C15 [Jaaginema sp. PMC 1080.18]MEC4865481.1 peptidase C15 [Jaaginema sp. PMC 1078.18]
MTVKLLLTSFQTWLPHQGSNSSDDLLGLMTTQTLSGVALTFLRKLPVDVELASQQAIAQIEALHPHWVVCCGMAESRSQLTIESNACWGDRQLRPSLNLQLLLHSLKNTQISHDAGKFVCEGLYFRVLSYFEAQGLPQSCIFVHVPILTAANSSEILQDFWQLIANLSQIENQKHL